MMLAGLATAVAAADTQESAAEKQRKLIDVLKSNAPPAEKAITCKRLAIYGDKDAVPALAPMLLDGQLASWARIALEAIPDPAASDALREALGKTQGQLSVGVINSLGVRGDPQAVSSLATNLMDPDMEVASAAAEALGHIGGDPSIKVLRPALASAPPPVRPSVAYGCILCAERLLVAGDRANAASLYDAVRIANVSKQRTLEATRGLILANASAGIPMLVGLLRSPDQKLRSLGLSVARELPGPDVSKALLAELDQAAPDRQPYLLQALADRGDAEVLPAALKAAKSGTPNLRAVAIAVLERSGGATAVPVLLAITAEDDAELAQAAKLALTRLPGADVDNAVVAMLRDPDAKGRRIALDLLTQRRVAGAVPALLKTAQDPDEKVRSASLKALGDLASPAELPAILDFLVKSQSPSDIQAAEGAVTAICARSAKPAANNVPATFASNVVSPLCADAVFAALLKAPNAPKLALLRVLRSIGGPRALDAVRTAAGDANAETKDTAIRALCDWPGAEALPSLAQLAKTAANPTFKILALRGYIRLAAQQDDAAGPKLAALKDAMALAERNEEKKLVLAALGKIPAVESLDLVRPHLANPELKEEAALAAVAIAEKIPPPRPAPVAEAMEQAAKATANEPLARRAKALAGTAP